MKQNLSFVISPSMLVAVVALLILGVAGISAYVAFAPSVNLLGWSSSQASYTEQNTSDQGVVSSSTNGESAPESTATSVSADTASDPAFDKLLPSLRQRTTAPIMLPAQLPSVMKNVAVDADLNGNKYGIAFFRDPPKNIVQTWARAEVVGTLRVSPKSETKPNKYFKASEVEGVKLPDGTEATIQHMEPVKSGGTQGLYWEGTFDESGYTYTLTMLDDPNGTLVRQALSSMVLVPESKTGGQGSVGNESELRQAVKDYYEAVDREDWDYTYQNLASPTRRRFSQEEWKRKNQWIADNDKLELSSIDIDADIPSSDPLAEVKVDRTFKDGSSLSRDTYFLYEDDSWKHLFAQEEIELFMPGTSFDQFVKAQQGGSSGKSPA